jgi:hypothetical protein
LGVHRPIAIPSVGLWKESFVMRLIFYVCGLVAAILTLSANIARAQTTSVGPYYATPSWDQTIACAAPATCSRLVVLANFNNEAVLDRETGLVWEKTPDVLSRFRFLANQFCLERRTGGRMGWRLPKAEELFSLIDPAQISGGLLALPPGHPFVVIAREFMSSSGIGPPLGDSSIAVDMYTGTIIPPFLAQLGAGTWCVRGSGGDGPMSTS